MAGVGDAGGRGGDESIGRVGDVNWLFQRLPPWVVDTLSTDQKEAIHRAVTDSDGHKPPVNIRFTLPWFSRRFFITVVAGEEMRGIERRVRERHRYPLRTVANIFFFIGVATLFYMLALAGLAIHTAIIQW